MIGPDILIDQIPSIDLGLYIADLPHLMIYFVVKINMVNNV